MTIPTLPQALGLLLGLGLTVPLGVGPSDVTVAASGSGVCNTSARWTTPDQAQINIQSCPTSLGRGNGGNPHRGGLPEPDGTAPGVNRPQPREREEPVYCSEEQGSGRADCRVVLLEQCESQGFEVVSPVDTGEFSGYVCAPAEVAEEIEEQDDAVDIMALLPGAVEEAFVTLPISGGSVEFEPDLLGFGYKGRHTHIFAETETQTLNETLLGIPVEIRVHPQTFNWDYGDGSTRTTYDPGEPLPNNWQGDAVVKTNQETPTSHVYSETGRYPVSLTTTFVGEYRVGGGPWIVIPGSVDVQASPGEADIWRVAARNVSGSCRNTADWGCDGPVTLEPGDTPPKIFAHLYDENGNWLGW